MKQELQSLDAYLLSEDFQSKDGIAIHKTAIIEKNAILKNAV